MPLIKTQDTQKVSLKNVSYPQKISEICSCENQANRPEKNQLWVKSREMQKIWRIFFTCISLSQQDPDDASFPNFRRKKKHKIS